MWVSGFRVQGVGFRVQGSGFGIQGLGFRGSGFRVQGLGFRVQGSGCRVQGSGFSVQGSECRVYGARALREERGEQPFAHHHLRTTISQKCAVVTEAGSYLRLIDSCITQLKAR